MSQGRQGPVNPRRLLAEVLGGVLTLALWIALSDWLSSNVALLADYGGALSAFGFVGLPLLFARWTNSLEDPLGMTDESLTKSLLISLGCLLIIVGPFIVGFDLVARQLWGQQRFAGPGLLSVGVAFQGRPPLINGRVQVFEHGRSIMVVNGLNHRVQIRSNGLEDASREIAPRDRLELSRNKLNTIEIVDPRGPVQASLIRLGRAQLPAQSSTLSLSLGWSWLLWLLISQLVMVAIPEEAFFRGWVLQHLRLGYKPKRLVFGTPFGIAHVLSAALFAGVHLVLIPAPHRLLVLFPALAFGWIAQRNKGILGAAIVHAGCNVMLIVVSRFYA
ncbi:MAG TPA: hypothetical protein DCQ06_12990 [Myxococcales bacterium]|nr:hypothetical protein [Myxococcales bacterium]HAN32505.1 hypothetical protein [Myxococcales bacterium]